MTTTMIKMGDGFFIPKLEGFDDIKKDTISVNIDLADEEHNSLSYKELKGIATMERYYNKLRHEMETNTNISEIQKEFREENNICMDLEKYLKES